MAVDNINFGEELYKKLFAAQARLFKLGEMVQLSHNAFELATANLAQNKEEQIKIKYPLGIKPDGQAIVGENEYKKQDLMMHYKHLSDYELACYGIYQLVTIVETVLGDCLQLILLKYPKKIGAKKMISLSTIFQSDSIEAIYSSTISMLINEFSYKSPREFATEVSEIYGFNLLEIPAYHQFIEIKATRDIFIHNRGIASMTYCNKAG